ncbi:hypothetical protein [Promicromonospora sp. NPDC059942]|uniref:hypothetical protein n=1 Tax=Promicromonospora sp. NPDC059942 TaxID=3347009 RepID=UPI003660147D
MTSYDHAPEPLDDSWLAHVREVSGGVVPPSPADAHALASVAVRRTRTRRAVLATGGGLTAVAAFAGAAFALGGPTTTGMLLPGGAPSTSVSDAAVAAATEGAADAAAGVAAGEAPAGWHTHVLKGLTYSLPPEIVTSGPVSDEPGVTSDMWHSEADPDAPPFLRMAFYDDGPESKEWPGIAERTGGEPFDLAGAKRAVELDVAAEVYGLPAGTEVPDDEKGPRLLVIEPATGPGAYYITLNLPPETAEAFVESFVPTLSLD